MADLPVVARFEVRRRSYLAPDGTLARRPPQGLADPAFLIPLYRAMVLSRTFDLKAVSLQRTGRLGTYAVSLGQEAVPAGVGAMAAFLAVDESLVREVAAMAARDQVCSVSNLNAPGRRPVFVKLRSKLEIARAEDAAAIRQAMPRLLDLFQTYLRETRPEELRGSAGTHRLREELVTRANIAVAPPAGSTRPAPRITDVLFTEILIQ